MTGDGKRHPGRVGVRDFRFREVGRRVMKGPASAAAGILLVAVIAVAGGCSVPRPGGNVAAEASPTGLVNPPTRIVSLAPSVTETLFALGVGDRVVGVTRYCDVPSEAAGRVVIGGYLDLNFETIVALAPDLVVGIRDSATALDRLRGLGLATLEVDQHDVSGILDSITTIGEACAVSGRAVALADDVQRRIDEVGRRTAGLSRPRAVIVVDRTAGTGRITTVWAAGPSTFYHELLALAGGSNAIENGFVVYPEVSAEGLLGIDPDVILEVTAELETRGLDRQRLRLDWDSLSTLRAVGSGRIYVLDQEYMVIPGPRVARIVEQFAHALHPDVDWSNDG
jgi:iron complex transport system substrate-binding protein